MESVELSLVVTAFTGTIASGIKEALGNLAELGIDDLDTQNHIDIFRDPESETGIVELVSDRKASTH